MDLLLSYINYEHGGRTGADYCGDGGPFDLSGLVRIMSAGGEWPHILGIGEADRWECNGGEGAYAAVAALRDAGGPAYVPHLGSLPREGGPFGPAVLIDPTIIQVHRWYDHRAADFASRNRNLLVASLHGRDERFRIIVHHGDIHSGDARLADAREFDRFADPQTPCVILGDWNSVPSGPMWEPNDLNTPGMHEPHRLAWRILWQHGHAQAGPHQVDTRALDYLIGYWTPQGRLGGIGFFDVAELSGDPTPTQLPRSNGRQPMAIDRILVNEPWAQTIVPGSYRVHQPADPDHPDSDHLRISVAIKV